MRIDLIPDVPEEPVKGKKKRVVIAPPTSRFRRVKGQKDEAAENTDYQKLLQSLYDAAIIADLDGRIAEVNARAVEHLRYDAETLRSMNITQIVSGADENLLATLCENLQKERFTVIEAYCTRSDGTFFPSEIAVNRLDVEGAHLCFFLRDITVRRQEQEMLMTEHNAIQNASNGIAMTGMDSTLEYVNPFVLRMWGYSDSKDILGYDIRGLFKDQDKAAEMLDMLVHSENDSWESEMVAVRENGDIFDVQVSAACNHNTEGEQIGMVFSFVDISDRKRMETAERESERNRVMLESLGAACHHLGQPATVLLANLGIIRKRLDGADEMVEELINSSITAAESLGEILHKLNTFNEYKTTQYLERHDGPDSPENRILDI